jgi:hypothetical protein
VYIGNSPSEGENNSFKILDTISSYTQTFDGSSVAVVSLVDDTLTFNNPFTSTTTASNLMVYGDIYATGNITAFAGAPSDFRLKENITTIPNALSMVSSMRGVMYDWTDEYLKSLKIDVNGLFPKRDTGVIAQEMQDVLPEVVFVKNNGDLSVKYEKIVGVLIEAIKELKSEVDTLKEKINTGS